MGTQCLICESSAVIDRQAARSIVLAIGALREFMQAWKTLKSEGEPAQWLLHSLSDAMSAVTHIHPDVQSFIADVERYQFGGFDCLCLRCGARFDAPSRATSVAQPASQ
ncbi:hypothetical protein KRX52_07240 [Pseudomonas sp. MAP12]|uniref:Uncharacterized protein n=1 Tax=Geopseudomonas aromaticivorans TaxID=2849492 RepID=A0ABS6MUV9_9GAMM|nr:hypothetical protein [Pseudomonas aromaticivorans]MBV2132598.1 hypothetical protein [Pseudomonas aromaticivorans]